MSVKRQKEGNESGQYPWDAYRLSDQEQRIEGAANDSLHYDTILWGLETGRDTSIRPLRKKGFPKVTLKFRRKGSTDFRLNIIHAQYDYIHSYTIG